MNTNRKAILLASTLAVACGASGATMEPALDASEASDAVDASSDAAPAIDVYEAQTAEALGSLIVDSSAPEEDSAPSLVYAHSSDTLYSLDPSTCAVTVVGPFRGCQEVIDLAIDRAGNTYVTSFFGFYRLDPSTAICTLVAEGGSYPNSLSFVPRGTLDLDAEALVGYSGSTYVRIDPATGAITAVGSLDGGYISSGDIVSVIDGGTFLTAKGGPDGGCDDCLVQVDPATGGLVQSYGNLGHRDVFGLAFWAGTAYGFDDAGEVFAIDWSDAGLVTTNIPVADAPAGLSFWGAGSTTSAPASAPDGAGIPIR